MFQSRDFDIDLIKHEADKDRKSIETVFSQQVYPRIHKPARVTGHFATLGDHLWSNDLATPRTLGILLSGAMDHVDSFTPVHEQWHFSPKETTITFRDYNYSITVMVNSAGNEA